MDLADRRVLAEELALPAAQLGHVVHQDQRTDVLATGTQRDRPKADDGVARLYLAAA